MNRYTQPNIEGFNKLEVIEASKVTQINPSTTNPAAQISIVLQYGASFEDIPLVMGTGQLTDDAVSDDSGEYHQINIQAEVAKTRRDVDQWIDENHFRDFVLKITDRNGNIRLAGTPDNPLRLSPSMSNPASGRNGYIFSWQGYLNETIPYLLSADAVTNSGRSFSTDYNTDFSL